MKLSQDKKTIDVSITRTLSAPDLENLISELALMRSGMEPPVPQSRPNPAAEGGKHITIEDEPAAIAARLRDGRIRLWLRNRGTGWMAYNTSVENALALRDYLIANLPGGTTDLFGQQVGDTH